MIPLPTIDFIAVSNGHTVGPLYERTDEQLKFKYIEVLDDLTIDLTGSNKQWNVEFSSCSFNGITRINNWQNISSISFEDCTFNLDFDSTNNQSHLVNFRLNRCTFKRQFLLHTIGVNAEISNSNFIQHLIISGNYQTLKLSSINENNSDLDEAKMFLRDVRCEKFELDGVLVRNVDISNFSSNQSMDLKRLTCHHLYLLNTIDTNFYFESSRITTIITEFIQSGKFSLSIKECIIYSQLLSLDLLINTSVSDSTIESLILTGFHKKDNLLILRDTNCRSLTFQDVTNEGQIFFRGVTINQPGALTIHSSSLGKADFINCNFTYANFEFYNSKMTEIFLAATTFPKKVRSSGHRNYEQAQLVFSQLFAVSQKQGDTIRAIEYQSREVESHYLSLKLWSKDFFKTINLWLNLISNNFGRYWALGILFTFGIGALFFYLLVITSHEYSIALGLDWDERFLSSYFKFINPLRFFDAESIFKINLNDSYLTLTPLSYLIDFLGRVFVAYGFYQIIQAFRRYGRK